MFMIQETLDDLKASIVKAQDSLRRDLAKVRTGRANPDLLDGVRVDYYGAATPLKQMASISVPEARMLMVKPFDRSSIKLIETAIVKADLGLNPSNDGELIRLPMPALTEERRKEFAKQAKKNGEECKVVIRKHRHEAKDMLDALEKDGDVGRDDVDRARKDLEDIVKAANLEVDAIVAKKERDILEV
jgi:ribosome recycling factor